VTLDLQPVNTPMLTTTASLGERRIVVQISGTADNETKPDLDRYIKQLHAEAVRHTVTAVELDLRQLEFMNSSSFKILIAWLAQIRDLDAAAQYKLQIRSNPNLLWQRRGLAALSCFAVDLVTIET